MNEYEMKYWNLRSWILNFSPRCINCKYNDECIVHLSKGCCDSWKINKELLK